jgi:hypothetical protein
MSILSRRSVSFAILFGLSAGSMAHAQATQSEGTIYPDSRVDIYAGYAYIHPMNSDINNFEYQPVKNPNVTLSVSAFFNHYVGVQVEGAYFSGNGEHQGFAPATGFHCSSETCDQLIYTAEAGPIVRFPLGRFVPFAHTLFGGARTNGPVAQPLKWGFGATGGVGVDYILPFWKQHLALRLVQADFYYSNVNYGPLLPPQGANGGTGIITAYKLSAGVDLRTGGYSPKIPVQLGCSVAPVSVFAGDPMQVDGTTLGTHPKLKQVYTWSSNGGRVVGNNLNPTIDTKGMTPGEYILHGHLAEGGRANQQADCEAPFTVRGYDPPTITCSATPNVAISGTQIAISTSGGSPQNRPLTYSYAATAGEVTSNGPTAKLVTAGLNPGVITISCNVVDDLGKTAQTTTTVTLNAAPVPVIPATQSMCSMSFDHDRRRPVRVDNQASACLDDVAIALGQQSDARLVIVGDYEAPETNVAAAQRAMNARLYLSQQKGIDPSRIELRVGDGGGRLATNTLVPSGAIFNEVGTHRFNEKAVTQHGEAYGRGAGAKKRRGQRGTAPPQP